MDAHRTEVAESAPDADAHPEDLEVIKRACRAFAYRQEEDAKKIDNPMVRGPVERMARHAAVLAERFAKARKAR